MSDLVIECDTPEDVAAHIRARANAFPGTMRQALWEESQITMNISKGRCPVDTGRMRATGNVEIIGDGDDLQAILSYATKYAPIVHENISGFWIRPQKARVLRFEAGGKAVFAASIWMPPNPRAKFLEGPVDERADAFPAGLLARTEAYIEQEVGRP